MDLTRAHWRKSSHSSAQGQCVEVATNLPGVAAIRDSKNPNGDALLMRPSTLASFIDSVKSDRFEN
ncbi:DUF397 domain-containing protein [Saccharopolyspora indica]|uniref:DUF397 domain-containing protein n=1 Tax=Saccharopolyspora indica TaxID=1229659 RepID=UPI0022EAE344|nr:DUF397 domain-containing protein [Saccharopolyspora indica]MDA3649890.1 DUF397 domain-containing protein [Saccharopolyspora indica]